jgi:hypothetical protein
MAKEPPIKQETEVPKARVLTVKNIYDKNYETLKVSGVWADVFGDIEAGGVFLIYGKDKNGKTWTALTLGRELSKNYRVLYMSAEEGVGKAFRDTLKRIGVDTSERNIHFMDYEPLRSLEERLSKRKSAEVIFIDNLTVYNKEFKGDAFTTLIKKYRNKLFVFMAHEERGEPYMASAKLAKKLASAIMEVKGLACIVSGRCPGGVLVIDEEKAQLFHNQNIKNEGKVINTPEKVLPAQKAERVLPRRGKKAPDTHPSGGR